MQLTRYEIKDIIYRRTPSQKEKESSFRVTHARSPTPLIREKDRVSNRVVKKTCDGIRSYVDRIRFVTGKPISKRTQGNVQVRAYSTKL